MRGTMVGLVAVLVDVLLAGNALAATPADKPLIAPPPAWVRPAVLPQDDGKPDEAEGLADIEMAKASDPMVEGRFALYELKP